MICAGSIQARFRSFFANALEPWIVDSGGQVGAELITETAANNFPRLPIRLGESHFVWLATFRDEAAERAFSQRLSRLSGWRDGAPEALMPALMRKPEVLRLAPTPRSRLG